MQLSKVESWISYIKAKIGKRLIGAKHYQKKVVKTSASTVKNYGI